MSSKIFVQYPTCASSAYEGSWNTLMRKHPILGLYVERVEISSTEHAIIQMRTIAPIRDKYTFSSYLVYIFLFVLLKRERPPTPPQLFKKQLFKEDRFKRHYVARGLKECAIGIFVPREDGMWPYDMWCNARLLFKQGKPVWQIFGNKTIGWNIALVDNPPERSQRLNRKQTISDIGLYSEPKVYPSLFSLIANALRSHND